MNVAVFSDSHDNLPNLERALLLAKEAQLSHGFHLGDFCSPFTVKVLADSGISWHCVWGNNDVDKGFCMRAGSSGVNFSDGDYREITLEGRTLFLTHYPSIARMAALSGKYSASFFGHNHRYSQETLENTLLANPGEIVGNRFNEPSFGIYTTENNTFKRVLL